MDIAKTYTQEPTNTMDFGAALLALRSGHSIVRQSWETKIGFLQWLSHDPEHKWPQEEKPTIGAIKCTIVNREGDHEDSRFSLHERDILANDWMIYEPQTAA